jgi:ATP-binding cassette subfamily C (CFTR/MRP) protein 1
VSPLKHTYQRILTRAAFVPTIFGPFASFVLSAIISGPLSAGDTFSSLAIISLLTSPASEFLENLPMVGMATSGLQRIQAFLLAPTHDDQRTSGHAPVVIEAEHSIELQDLAGSRSKDDIIVDRVSVRPATDTPMALQDINFRALRGSLTMIIGVVGSGKSTLLKTLAGELAFEGGSIRVGSKQMAYCAQTPWLQNATVRQIICGPSEEVVKDSEWYNTVVQACAFDEDIQQLPNRDETLIGSRGVVLSGGQKQRLVRHAPISTG